MEMKLTDLYLKPEETYDCFETYDEQDERLEKVVKASANHAVKKVVEYLFGGCPHRKPWQLGRYRYECESCKLELLKLAEGK